MKKAFTILLLSLASTAAMAGGPGTEVLPFLQQDFNPSSLAMGGTSVGSAATVPFMDCRFAAGVSYLDYLPKYDECKYFGGGAAGRLGNLGLSLDFTRGSGEPAFGDSFSPYRLLADAGISYKFVDFLSVGVNAKYAKEQLLDDYGISSTAADIFLAGKVRGFAYEAGVSNLGPAVKSDTGSWSLPSAFTVAGSYVNVVSGLHRLEAKFKIDYYFSGCSGVSAGAQYGFADLVFVRGGYHYGGETIIPSYASAGLGLKFFNVTLDAVCLFASDTLQDSFGFSLGVSF